MTAAMVMSDLDKVLPITITGAAVRSGNELVIPLPEVMHAIHVASEHLIAVLGVESFRILENGFGCEDYTDYAFEVGGDWPAYVRSNYEAARRFIDETQLREGYGYILTSSSENEFKELQGSRGGPHGGRSLPQR
jgi:hypothetical protein